MGLRGRSRQEERHEILRLFMMCRRDQRRRCNRRHDTQHTRYRIDSASRQSGEPSWPRSRNPPFHVCQFSHCLAATVVRRPAVSGLRPPDAASSPRHVSTAWHHTGGGASALRSNVTIPHGRPAAVCSTVPASQPRPSSAGFLAPGTGYPPRATTSLRTPRLSSTSSAGTANSPRHSVPGRTSTAGWFGDWRSPTVFSVDAWAAFEEAPGMLAAARRPVEVHHAGPRPPNVMRRSTSWPSIQRCFTTAATCTSATASNA